VVAEGVENLAQLAVLQELGCRYAQGFLFARPGDFESCCVMLDSPERPTPASTRSHP
jgi:EAL domain-containing protein (putative c-di-GMP-specific phosphodiesterase class I)